MIAGYFADAVTYYLYQFRNSGSDDRRTYRRTTDDIY